MRNLISLFLLASLASAQTYSISTLAGGTPAGLTTGTGDGGNAISAALGASVSDVAVDGFGNVYIATSTSIRKVSPDNKITTMAGGGNSVMDFIPAVQAAIAPAAIVSSAIGTVYFADVAFGASRIRRIDSSGIITTVAGGTCCNLGDGGPALSAYLGMPYGLALDAAGNLYIAQSNLGDDRIRKMTTDGTITTVAGGGNCCALGDGGAATNTILSSPTGIAVDSAGTLYIAEYAGNRVRSVSGGIIQTIAGNGSPTDTGDGGRATGVGLAHPWHVGVDAGVAGGAVLISQPGSAKIRILRHDGSIATAAGNGSHGYSGDGSGAMSATLDVPAGIASANNGVFYFADSSAGIGRVRKLTPSMIRPLIKPGGVVPVFSSSSMIQAGEWVSLYGSNLASATTSWNGDFPTSLGDTSVMVNGKPAYLWFVSPGQINFQAPDDMTIGMVQVSVTTPAGSFAAPVQLNAYGPSFSLLNNTYPAAMVLTPGAAGNSGAGYDIIGPATGFNFPTRPVHKGETLVLFGVGFGPTTPTVPAGRVFSSAATAVVTPQVTIGGVAANVTFSGIVQAGLFQLNVVVPNVPAGNQPLLAKVGGVTTPAYVAVSVQ